MSPNEKGGMASLSCGCMTMQGIQHELVVHSVDGLL
jgi:hypothetical protein